MIGTQENAALAAKMFNGYDYSMLLSNDGTTRTVYLIDGVVYKVGSNLDCRTEFDNITNCEYLPEGVFFPETSLFEVSDYAVIAMEYIKGQAMSECLCLRGEVHTSTCMPEDIHDKVSEIIGDTGGENVILTDTGDIYIIDAAA